MSSGPEELLGLSGNEVLYRLNICIPTSANADLYTCKIYTLEIVQFSCVPAGAGQTCRPCRVTSHIQSRSKNPAG